ncbi:MAG TPA: NAD-dependent epimerase/dehydratase family protein [Xanthobacteraceae bacterium]|nr:NAD-dependent epimerase/dehydratase family protein [Xanthobacteraceae bacterium]
MPQRLVVTGASGYIGARLVERALRRGCEVVVLGSRPAGANDAAIAATPWRLGEPPRVTALANASAVVHLAHDWASDRLDGTGPGNVNLNGAETLARMAREAGVRRFVFASTTSARPEALNAYGKIKFALEERLRALPNSEGGLFCARIGLVYGGPERAQYGLMAKLASLPLLPMIGLDREVQPIHLDEVCDGLLALALDPPAGRQTVVLAGPTPMTFGHWLRTLRRARHGRRLQLIPMPIGFALVACDMTKAIPFLPSVERERVLGLAGAAPMASAEDLAALGLTLRDPADALTNCRPARRRLIAECRAMLRYVAGRRLRSPGAIIRLARVARRDPAFRRALPRLALRWPGLLRLIEPIRPSMQHGLSRRLHLAAMVAESLPDEPPQLGLGVLTKEMLLEAGALPFRLAFARVYA